MNTCSCIKGVYNFNVETPDNKNIIYTDLSDWMVDEVHSIPEFYTIKIYLPGSSTAKEVSVSAKSKTSTRIEAVDLGLGCIPDGPYTFEVESCGTKYIKKTVLIPNLRCCYSKLLALEGVTDKSKEILTNIKSVEFNSELQNIKAANSNFKIAKVLLERIKCNCNC